MVESVGRPAMVLQGAAADLDALRRRNVELVAFNTTLLGLLGREKAELADVEDAVEGSGVAVLCLDDALNIRAFTRSAGVLFRFIDSDIGRPLADLAFMRIDAALFEDARSVMATRTPLSRRVGAADGIRHLRHIAALPSANGEACGVVITYHDVPAQRALPAESDAPGLAGEVVQRLGQAIAVFDPQGGISLANPAFRHAFGLPDELLPSARLPLPAPFQARSPLRSFIEMADPAQSAFEGTLDAELPGLGARRQHAHAQRMPGGDGVGSRTLVAIDDVTEKEADRQRLEDALIAADEAREEQSRFLASANHRLRQPLQIMSMLHGLLATTAEDAQTLRTIEKLDVSLTAMSDILDALLQTNRMETASLQATPTELSLSTLFDALDTEFEAQAEIAGLSWRVVPSSANVVSDPRLLKRMLHNIITNALKAPSGGHVLVGCRRRTGGVRIEVWTIGSGHSGSGAASLGDASDARLGMAITRRLGRVLNHAVGTRQIEGRGAVVTIDLPLGASASAKAGAGRDAPAPDSHILVVDSDAELGNAICTLLKKAGYDAVLAADAPTAIKRAEARWPRLVITDQRLPSGMTGIMLIDCLREMRPTDAFEAMILTGDTSSEAMARLSDARVKHLAKPVRAAHLIEAVRTIMPPTHGPELPVRVHAGRGKVFIVDDDPLVRRSTAGWLESQGWATESFASGPDFLRDDNSARRGCVLIDSVMEDMDGLALIERLRPHSTRLSTIMITGNGDMRLAVAAVTAGASDIIEKPVNRPELLRSIERAISLLTDQTSKAQSRAALQARLDSLTPRQREILDLVIAGHPSKNIAADLALSQRTVDTHRAAIMRKLDARSLAQLVRRATIAE